MWNWLTKAGTIVGIADFVLTFIIGTMVLGIIRALKKKVRKKDAYPSDEKTLLLMIDCSVSENSTMWNEVYEQINTHGTELSLLQNKAITASSVANGDAWAAELTESSGKRIQYCYNGKNQNEGRGLLIQYGRLDDKNANAIKKGATQFRTLCERIFEEAGLRGVTSVCLFFRGPIEMAYTVGKAANNKMPIYLFHRKSTDKSEYVSMGQAMEH